MDQIADAEYAGKRKRTRREVFLEEVELVAPRKLHKLIEPSTRWPAGGQAVPAGVEPRVHLMQNWFALSDPAMEDCMRSRCFASLRT